MCDQHLFNEGTPVFTAVGRSKAAQKVVEALSHEIDSKCDFRVVAGRIKILVEKEKVSEACDLLYSPWIRQFIVQYSEKSYDDETYFVPEGYDNSSYPKAVLTKEVM